MPPHEQFMRLAIEEGKAALEAGDFPVGCVLVENGRVLARDRRKNSSGPHANEIDHAEILTLRNFLRGNPRHDLSGVTAYSTMEPCLMCYTTLLLSGIRTFVWAYEDIMGGGTALPLGRLPSLYAEMRVECTPRILRIEALLLFQDFFRRYPYWADSELASYTLAQEVKET